MSDTYGSKRTNLKELIRKRKKRRVLIVRLCMLGICILIIAGGIVGFTRLVPTGGEGKEELQQNVSQDQTDNGEEEQSTINTIGKQYIKEEWALILINNKNPIPTDYKPDLQEVGDGYRFDQRAAQDLIDMMNAAKEEGLSPFICSAYRSEQKQTRLYNNEVTSFKKKGYSEENARIQARTVVAYPGTSEHEYGIAVDIVSRRYQILNEKQANTAEAIWLKENCAKYGFILRYPPNKKDITGVIFEPWHYRYVGKVAAEEIMSKGICLEEYLKQ